MKESLIKKGYYNSPIGILEIIESDGYIVEINFVEDDNCLEEFISEEIEKCKIELEEYFNGRRSEFSVKVDLAKGTEFQKKVWNALRDIPYGETVSYKEIAEKIGNPKAVRAVGGANNKNPIPIIIPCHRVSKKECLLNLENENK